MTCQRFHVLFSWDLPRDLSNPQIKSVRVLQKRGGICFTLNLHFSAEAVVMFRAMLDSRSRDCLHCSPCKRSFSNTKATFQMLLGNIQNTVGLLFLRNFQVSEATLALFLDSWREMLGWNPLPSWSADELDARFAHPRNLTQPWCHRPVLQKCFVCCIWDVAKPTAARKSSCIALSVWFTAVCGSNFCGVEVHSIMFIFSFSHLWNEMHFTGHFFLTQCWLDV